MSSNLLSRKFKKEISSLGEIFSFIEPIYKKFQITDETAYCISLAVEEVFTNMVKYNSTSQNDILISLEKKNESIEAVLVDYDVEQYEPEPISDSEMDELRNVGALGGRGVYLIHKVVDNLNYEYKNNNCIVKILKKTE